MANFSALYEQAHAAGLAAVSVAKIEPMIVQQCVSPFNDASPVVKQYFVEDGVCGFAWIKVKGNTAFGKWLKANRLARPGYPNGLQISVRHFEQSLQKKEAYARAFASVLQAGGIEAYADSRID